MVLVRVHRQLLKHIKPLLICKLIWLDIFPLKEVEELSRNFFQYLPHQLLWIIFKLSKWHKLYNICIHLLAVLFRVEWFIISIKNVHALELITSHTDYDDRDRKLATYSDNLIDSLIHVVDNAIGDHQQNVVALAILSDARVLSHVVHVLDDWCKPCRTI